MSQPYANGSWFVPITKIDEQGGEKLRSLEHLVVRPDRLASPSLVIPEPMIDFGQVGHAEALEDVQRLDAVPFVVEDDVEDRAAQGHRTAEVAHRGVVQALLIAHAARKGGKRRVGTPVEVDQVGH